MGWLARLRRWFAGGRYAKAGDETGNAHPMTDPASFMTAAVAHAIARQCMRNRDQICAAAYCGCFYCEQIFDRETIRDWTDDDQTALCPHCGVDSVLANITDADTLKSLHHYQFGPRLG